MLRVIKEAKPRWVVGENVTGIINLALDEVLASLETEGYETQCFIIPACGVDAPHRRDRVWIVANTICDKHRQTERRSHIETQSIPEFNKTTDSATREFSRASSIWLSDNNNATNPNQLNGDVPGFCTSEIPQFETSGVQTYSDSQKPRLEWTKSSRNSCSDGLSTKLCEDVADTTNSGIEGMRRREDETADWIPEPGMGRVAHGIPNRSHRLKGLGNAIVPQVAQVIFEAIKCIDKGEL